MSTHRSTRSQCLAIDHPHSLVLVLAQLEVVAVVDLGGFAEPLCCAANDRNHLGYYCLRTQLETFVEDHLPRLSWEGAICTLRHFPQMFSFVFCQPWQPLQLSDLRTMSTILSVNAPQADSTGLEPCGAVVAGREDHSVAVDREGTVDDELVQEAAHKLHREECLAALRPVQLRQE